MTSTQQKDSSPKLADDKNHIPVKGSSKSKFQYEAPISDNEPQKNHFKDDFTKDKTQSQSSKLFRNLKDSKVFNESLLASSLKRESFQKDFGHSLTKSTPKKHKHWPSERSPIRYSEAYRNLLESDLDGKNIKEIEAENFALRRALKEMNEELQRAIEKVKVVDLVGKKKEFKDKDIEDKLRTIFRELANNEKIMTISQEEARKVQARIEGLKDGDYFYNIQQEIKDIKRQIEEIRRENKKLEVKSDAIGKNLDHLENVKGNPSIIEEIHAKQDELVMLKEKLMELKRKNQLKAEEREAKLEKSIKLNEELKKLEKKVQPFSEVSAYMEKAFLQHNILTRQVKILEEDLKHSGNKNKKFLLTQKERELEEIYVKNQKERDHFERLDDIIGEQVMVLRNMTQIEEKTSNKTVQEIVKSMKSNLDREEKKREITAQSFGEVANEIDKDYQTLTLRKEKNLKIGLKVKAEMYSGLPIYSPGVSKYRSATTNNRNVVKRELVDNRKKPMWKENKGGYNGRPESNLLNKLSNQKDFKNDKLYSKPLGLKKSEVKKNEEESNYGHDTGRSHYETIPNEIPKQKNDGYSQRSSHNGDLNNENEEDKKINNLASKKDTKLALNLNIKQKEDTERNNGKESNKKLILKNEEVPENNDDQNEKNKQTKKSNQIQNRRGSPSPMRSSRKSSPGKRSDLEIDVEAIEREHEGVFDFKYNSNEKLQSNINKDKERIQDNEKNEKQKNAFSDSFEDFNHSQPKEKVMKQNQDIEKNDEEIKQIDNRIKKNMELQEKKVPKKNDEDFEEFDFDN